VVDWYPHGGNLGGFALSARHSIEMMTGRSAMPLFPIDPARNPRCAFSRHWRGSTVVIGCSGDLDMLTAPELERHLADAIGSRPAAIVVDMSGVDFLSARAMDVLAETHRRVSADIDFAVVADGPATSRPMRLIGMADLFSIHPTLAAALRKSAS
jgi:anti-anti-sigma factor